MTENYVLNELLCMQKNPYFWRSGNSAELDFLFENDGKVVPVEVKAATNTQAKSYKQFCKKFASDADQVESAIQEALSFTKAIGHEAAYTDANMEYGKFLTGRGKERDAITCFSEVANYAENHHNTKLLGAAKYYLGFCLYHLEHLSMANSFLREATEIAFRERNHILAQTSETLRAIVLMKQGKNDEAQVVFHQWERNFGLVL